jgi:hypothetical protein
VSVRGVRELALRAFALACGLSASLARACPVCFSAKDEAQRQAFFDTTIFLTLLPLVVIGGFIYWVARRIRRLDAESSEREGRGAAPGPTAR